MKKNVLHAFIANFLLLFTACLLLANCGWENTENNNQCIDYNLRGTWEREVDSFWPTTYEKGKLVLKYETIVIIGQVAHLQGFTRNTVLEAYTEDNNLYIKDRGVWQSPINFIFWKSASYPQDKFVTFKGGGRADETFKLISNLY
jgi:hypothetical protein